MKFLHFSDLHSNQEQIIGMLEIIQLENPSVVVISGDFTHWTDFPQEDTIRFKHCLQQLEELNNHVPVAVVSGNHEAWSNGSWGEKLWCSDGKARHMDGFIFTCFPWSDTGFNGEAYNEEKKLRERYPQARSVWIHHEPANGSSCAWNGFSNEGNWNLQHLIRSYKPRYLLSGHIHCAPYAGGRPVEPMFETTCCNPGSSATRDDQFYTKYPSYICVTDNQIVWYPGKDYITQKNGS